MLNTKHWWLDKIEKFQCSNVIPGQLQRKPFTCLELRIPKYEAMSVLLNKIRLNMGKRDSQYKLKGEIEMGDNFFETVDFT